MAELTHPDSSSDAAVSRPRRDDLLELPVSAVSDGWKLKDGCLYLLVTPRGTRSEHAVIVRRNGCTRASH